MMGEAFFKTANLQKNTEIEELKLKTGFFRTCTLISVIIGVLPILATKIAGEGLRSQSLHFIGPPSFDTEPFKRKLFSQPI